MTYSPLVSELRTRLGPENVLSAPSELAVYDCDALTIHRQMPAAVVFPRTTRQVADVVRICRRRQVPVVPRGAGTSLAGGCLPVREGVLVVLSRMNRIRNIDLRNRMAEVEPGVVNLQLARALAGTGFHFAPDPSSQGAATIGGNVGTNAGGPHTLKYGVTVNHVLGLETVLADGAVLQVGPVRDPAELDLLSALVGSEGTLGIVTRVWVRLTPDPQDCRTMRAIFDSVGDATRCVSAIIAAGIIPAALELMDQGILAAVEEAFHFGFPPDAGAVLIIEVDGPTVALVEHEAQVVEFCRRHGAREVLQASSAQERTELWKCRKLAIGSLGRLSPSYLLQDGVVPRTRLPEVLERIMEIGARHSVRIVNVAHAGDGNVHPIMLFDERDRQQVSRALAAGAELLEACIALGGSISAEHGVGVEKIALMDRLFDQASLRAQARLRRAFDPQRMFNPDKVLPAGVRDKDELEQPADKTRKAEAP